MNARNVVSQLVTVIALGCAVIVTAAVVRRELLEAGSNGEHRPNIAPRPVEAWKRLSSSGHRMGPVDAKVVIVEFADFECPYCRAFWSRSLKAIRKQYPRDVAVVFRHWPLQKHRFSYPAARAAECADRQGRFDEFHDHLYELQDSLGLKSWADLAVEAGVKDTNLFKTCIRDTSRVPSIETDIRVAESLKLEGTPSVFINGMQYFVPPDSTELYRVVMATRRHSGD